MDYPLIVEGLQNLCGSTALLISPCFSPNARSAIASRIWKQSPASKRVRTSSLEKLGESAAIAFPPYFTTFSLLLSPGSWEKDDGSEDA